MAVLRILFTLPDGGLLEREWFLGDRMPEWISAPPPWLEDPARAWDHPQDPITLSGRVKPGFEDEARKMVGP